MENKSAFPKISEAELDEFYEEPHLISHYWFVISKHKWNILSLTIATSLLSVVIAYSMQPVYQSTATLVISGGGSLVNTENDPSLTGQNAKEYYGTQIEILKSRGIAEAALAQLKRDHMPLIASVKGQGHTPSLLQKWMLPSWLDKVGIATATPVADSGPDIELLRWLYSGLSISPVRNTQMIAVSFESINPQTAAIVANAVTQAYIEDHLAQRAEIAQDASKWLQERMEKSQQSVVKATEALQRYRVDAGLIDVEGLQNVYAEQLKIIAASLGDVQRLRVESENQYRLAKQMQAIGQMGSLPIVANNAWIQSLREQENELERKIKLDSARFRGEYPGLDEAQENLNTIRQQINTALDEVVVGLKTNLEVAIANEKQLDDKLTELQSKVQEFDYLEFQAEALEQVVLTNRQSYDAFLSKLMETSTLSEDTISVIARVVDAAAPNLIPVKPKKKRIVMVATTFALLVGVGFAILLDRLNNTLQNREEVIERLAMPVFGEVIDGHKDKIAGKEFVSSMAFTDQPSSSFAENIRTVRTGVAMLGIGKTERVILVTSSVPAEGKSTMALNFALAMGQLGNVLLIDADLRKPVQAKLCRLDSQQKGLIDLVAGTAKVNECIKNIAGHIHLMPAGSALPEDPQTIFSTERFSQLINKLSLVYDSVVIDSSPLEAVSDAIVLTGQADVVVYVIKADDTPYQTARSYLNDLRKINSNIGIVLNMIDPTKGASYGKYSKYGSYRYSQSGYGRKA